MIQFKPSALAEDQIERSLRTISSTGASLVEYVAHNGYIVRTDPASYSKLAASGLLQFVGPYHPGYKVARDIGTAPLPDPERAGSTVYSLIITGFPGVDTSEIANQVRSLGGDVTLADSTPNGPVIAADLDMTQVFPLSKIEGIRDIHENLPRFKLDEEMAWSVIAGAYSLGVKPQLYLDGVTGAGGPGTIKAYRKDVDVAPFFVAGPPPFPVSASDTDFNGNGVLDNAAQIIAVTDTGMAVDAGDFAETASSSGWTGVGGATTCTANLLGPNVGDYSNGMHRKVAWYERSPTVAGVQGDLCSCDPGSSHGTVVASVAAGSASSGPFAADGIDWSGDGATDDYGTPFFFVVAPDNFRVDGTAYGARVIFQDANTTCPEPPAITISNLVTEFGDARTKGARTHVFSFGSFNNTATSYDSAAVQIDNFLSTDTNRDYMVFLASGNAGSATSGTNGHGKSRTVVNEASAKNAVSLGANREVAGIVAFSLNARATFSAVGPAPNGELCSPQSSKPDKVESSNCGRIKPDLMAPGQDTRAAPGLISAFYCASNDGDQLGPVKCTQSTGAKGTSVSAANAAGTGALVRDYFAQGLYPDGTSGNAANDTERQAKVSGALVKAMLIASAQHMFGAVNLADTSFDHRFNPESGYGFINLRNALPLVTDPDSPGGLLVQDVGQTSAPTMADIFGAGQTGFTGVSSATATFDVYRADQPLTAALSWVEPSGQALINNLDLELRYCGPDGNCATTDGVCANGGPASNNGTACTADATCTGGAKCKMDRLWYGNVFTEDRDDDGTEDAGLDLDGLPGLPPPQPNVVDNRWRSEGAFSLANVDANLDDASTVGDVIAPRDTRNNNEAIFLSNDPNADGTTTTSPFKNSDTQVFTGKWQVKVSRTNSGTNVQRYALVIAGGVTKNSAIRFDTNPVSCNGDVAVIVDEVLKPNAEDPLCCTAGGGCVGTCTESNISSRVTLTVKTAGGSVVDKETSIPFHKDPKAFTYTSDRLPASTAIAGNPSGTPPTDKILLGSDGYVMTATYTDSKVGGTIDKTTTSTFGCSPIVRFLPIGQVRRDARFLLAGGCDTDKYMDSGESFTYRIRFRNDEPVLTLTDIVITLRAVQPDGDNATDPGRLNNTPSSDVSIPSPVINVARVDPGFTEDSAFTVSVTGAHAWASVPAAPPQVEMVAGITSTLAGKSFATYQVFSHLLSADDESFLYSTDYPTGAIVDRDIGPVRGPLGASVFNTQDENISNPIVDPKNPFPSAPLGFRGNVDGLFETISFDDMTATNPSFNGPWDFDGDDEGFRSGLFPGSRGNVSEISNWGEDSDYDGVMSGRYICRKAPTTGCDCKTCVGGASPPNTVCTPTAVPTGCTAPDTCIGPAPAAGCQTDTVCPKVCSNDPNKVCLVTTDCTNPGTCAARDRCLHLEDFNGNQNGALDQNWGNGGGCGFVSNNSVLATQTGTGVWHTGTVGTATAGGGLGTCAGFGESNCENFDIVPGSAAVGLWREFLRTPIINKVHSAPDDRGVDYRVELRDWRWNMNSDVEPFDEYLNYEFDEDADTPDPVDLQDGATDLGNTAFLFKALTNGLGPISGTNVNLLQGWPLFNLNDPDDDVTPFGQSNGSNTGAPNRNRVSDRSCFFQNFTFSQANTLLRGPKPLDDDCDNDIVSLGTDGAPGKAGVDDDSDNAVDNPEEACPCYKRADAIDNDADTRTDEGDELQRFYRCSISGARCVVVGVNTDNCGSGNGTCGHNGDGKPLPFGDDVCGDGKLDENVSKKWTDTNNATLSGNGEGELGHRLGQNTNYDISTFNGPFIRNQTLEDFYDREAGAKFQGAMGFTAQEGSPSNPAVPDYGVAFDDMTVEWAESHPVQQTAAAGCGSGTCASGARSGKLCFNDDDCGTSPLVPIACSGATASATASCAALSWGANALFAGSGVVALNLVDFNAQTTQGGLDCTKYGFTVPGANACCGGAGNCSNGSCNDCDNDGLKEVEVTIVNSGEPQPESIRLEQTASGSSSYTGLVTFSSAIAAPGDGVIFLQYNGAAGIPTAIAQYLDKDSGNADVNGDGTLDGPPGPGKDLCAGFCGTDENKNATGPDKKPGLGFANDDNNGVCDFKSSNAGDPCTISGSRCIKNAAGGVNGSTCTANANCGTGVGLCAVTDCRGGGSCLDTDEPDELCGRTCTGGAGICNGGANQGRGCTGAGDCTGGVCAATNCNSNADCVALCVGGINTGRRCTVVGDCPGSTAVTPNIPAGVCTGPGTCPAGTCRNGTSNGASCATTTDCLGGYCAGPALADDNCSNIDEAAEVCAIVGGRLPPGIDDNCGCSANPVTATLTATYSTADIIVQSYAFTDNGDNDGFADDNELVSLKLTLRNVSSFDVDDLDVRLATQSANTIVGCINDASAHYGRVDSLQSKDNGGDTLSFTVANVDRQFVSDIKQATMVVTVTGVAILDDGSRVPVAGTATPQSFTFDLDLDSSGSAPTATTTRIFSFESGAGFGQYASSAAWANDWFTTLFLAHDGLHCQYNDPSGSLAGSAPLGCFLNQDGIRPSDWHLHSPAPGGIQNDGTGRDSGVPGTCSLGKHPGATCGEAEDCPGGCSVGSAHAGNDCTNAPGNTACSGTCSNDATIGCLSALPTCRFCNGDHTKQCTSDSQCQGIGDGTCPAAGNCTFVGTCTNPAPGTCTGAGNASMHWGYHEGPTQAEDTAHEGLIQYVYYPNTTATGTGATLQLGLGRPGVDSPLELSFFQQVAIPDDRLINIASGESLDAAVVHVLVDRNNDSTQQLGPPSDGTKDGFWEKVKPWFGVPNQQRPIRVNNCTYDPDDDGNNEDDVDDDTVAGRAKGPSSSCFPEFVWACIGDTTDAPYDPDIGNGPPDAHCFPEVDVAGNPIVRKGTGPGRWVQAKFDLTKYKGRKIWFRFLETSVQFGFTTWNAAFGAPVGGNREDGWYVDDLRITGTTPTAFQLKRDEHTNVSSACGGGAACSGIVAKFTGSTFLTRTDTADNNGDATPDEADEGGYGTVSTDAPLRVVLLNGRDFQPSLGTCVGGVLQFRFWADHNLNGVLDAGELIRDFNEDPRTAASPLCTELIKMDVRCSNAAASFDNSTPGCHDTGTLKVVVGGLDFPLNVTLAASKTSMSWNTQLAASNYDVAFKRFTGTSFLGDFTGFLNPLGGSCLTGCGLASTSYSIGCKGTPSVGQLDMWIIRIHTPTECGTWNEGGNQVGNRDPEVPACP